jgi:hypothetical protein
VYFEEVAGADPGDFLSLLQTLLENRIRAG